MIIIVNMPFLDRALNKPSDIEVASSLSRTTWRRRYERLFRWQPVTTCGFSNSVQCKLWHPAWSCKTDFERRKISFLPSNSCQSSPCQCIWGFTHIPFINLVQIKSAEVTHYLSLFHVTGIWMVMTRRDSDNDDHWWCPSATLSVRMMMMMMMNITLRITHVQKAGVWPIWAHHLTIGRGQITKQVLCVNNWGVFARKFYIYTLTQPTNQHHSLEVGRT